MRKKVSTLIEENLFRRARLESARQGKQISQVIGEALEMYLDSKSTLPAGNVVADSWNALKLPRAQVEKILGEEEGFLDA